MEIVKYLSSKKVAFFIQDFFFNFEYFCLGQGYTQYNIFATVIIMLPVTPCLENTSETSERASYN